MQQLSGRLGIKGLLFRDLQLAELFSSSFQIADRFSWAICRTEPYVGLTWRFKIEPVHEISNNVVCATSKASNQPAHTHSLIRAFASHLNIVWVLSYWLNTFGVSKLKRRLQRLVWVYTCQNATLLEITCHGSIGKIALFQYPRWMPSWIKQHLLNHIFGWTETWWETSG